MGSRCFDSQQQIYPIELKINWESSVTGYLTREIGGLSVRRS